MLILPRDRFTSTESSGFQNLIYFYVVIDWIPLYSLQFGTGYLSLQ